MPQQLTTYSGLDWNLAITNPLFGSIQASGVLALGIQQVTVRMTVDHAELKVGMDGAVIPTWVPGNQGEIEIQVWQTSVIHHQFLGWFNAINAAAMASDVSNAFSGVLLIQSILDGSSHTAIGVAPVKVPDKNYGPDAVTCNWVFRAANIINE